MSFTKKILKTGEVTSEKAYKQFAKIPYVGKFLGHIAGSVVFVAVEPIALVVAGGYLAGKGIQHGVKHMCHSHDPKEPQDQKIENNNQASKETQPSQVPPATGHDHSKPLDLPENVLVEPTPDFILEPDQILEIVEPTPLVKHEEIVAVVLPVDEIPKDVEVMALVQEEMILPHEQKDDVIVNDPANVIPMVNVIPNTLDDILPHEDEKNDDVVKPIKSNSDVLKTTMDRKSNKLTESPTSSVVNFSIYQNNQDHVMNNNQEPEVKYSSPKL